MDQGAAVLSATQQSNAHGEAFHLKVDRDRVHQ